MRKTLILLAIIAFVLNGCGTSYLQTSTNVSKTKKQYDQILVVSRSKDKTARIAFENKVVEDLKAQGVNAASSFDVIKMDILAKEPSESDIASFKKELIKKGFNGVIVTNLINANQYTDVVPGTTGTAYYPVRYGRFGRYYSLYPVNYWGPDQVETGVEYTLESCLYDITESKGDNLQWIGRFKVRNPSDLMKTIDTYSKELTDALLKESISL